MSEQPISPERLAVLRVEAEAAAIDAAERQADFDDALARAFANIEAAKKDSDANYGKFADLASVTDAIRGPLTAEGFSWPQKTSMSDDGRRVIIETGLRRKGICISSTLAMPVERPTAQGVGSAITYARRYALSAITGVCPDDDDGNAASQGGGQQKRKPAKKAAKTEPAPEMPKEWHAAHGVYKKVSKRRADVIQANGLLGKVPTNAQLLAIALGLKAAPRGRDVTAEQWTTAARVFGDDIDDIELTLETAKSEAHERAEEVAGEFGGEAERVQE